MIFEFISFGCLGLLRPGMSRKDVRDVLGGDVSTFKKGSDDANETDDYGGHRVHVYYDADDRLEGAKFLRGSEFYLEGMKVVGGRCSLVCELFLKCGVKMDADTAGFKARELGLSFYVPEGGSYEVDALV